MTSPAVGLPAPRHLVIQGGLYSEQTLSVDKNVVPAASSHAAPPPAAPAAAPAATPAVTFASLGLPAASLAALTREGYVTPTPIQAQAIPFAMQGRDVIGCAATGTGKTAAFVLPMVERLAGKTGTRALILAPTRELVLQIATYVELFGAPRGVKSTTIIGGAGMDAQRHALRSQPTVIVATPGRLVDHLDKRAVHFDNLEVLVLDEADRMLDMGFKPQLDRILQRVPKKRQTLLFSATMAGEVAEFAAKTMQNPARVEIVRSGTTASRVTQRVFLVPQTEKQALLMTLLEEDNHSTLVFTRTKRRADRVAKALEKAGHEVGRIHADRSLGQRKAALEGFRSGKYRVLVATDIAARGIDVENIGHVVLFDLPHVPEDYVHRIGRTARAEASGKATSFSSDDEMPLLRDIERLIRAPLPRTPLPRDNATYQEELKRRVDAPGPREQRAEARNGAGGGQRRGGPGGQRRGGAGGGRGGGARGGKSAGSSSRGAGQHTGTGRRGG